MNNVHHHHEHVILRLKNQRFSYFPSFALQRTLFIIFMIGLSDIHDHIRVSNGLRWVQPCHDGDALVFQWRNIATNALL